MALSLIETQMSSKKSLNILLIILKVLQYNDATTPEDTANSGMSLKFNNFENLLHFGRLFIYKEN